MMEQLLLVRFGKSAKSKVIAFRLKNLVEEAGASLDFSKTHIKRLMKQGAVSAEFFDRN